MKTRYDRRTTVPLAILIAAVTASCNFAKQHARKCDNRLERHGYTQRIFHDASGAHATWFRESGRPKILLLHGYTGTGALQWSNTVRLLDDDRDAILPDLLCHGRSAKWDTTSPGTNIDAQAAQVLLILDSLGITGPIEVVGNSYGGGVAARFTELHPDRVQKLVIYDGLLSDYTAAMADSIARSVGSTGMLAVMGTPSPKDLRYGIRLALYRDPPLPGFLLNQMYREFAEPYRPAQVTLIKDLMANEALFVHKRYDWKVPVYVIWGERDELIPNSTGRAILLRNELPEDHWIVVPRTGHVANIERPKAFDEALRSVLAR